MARGLIRLKLTLLRHGLRGGESTFLWLGAAVGLTGAGWLLLQGFEAGRTPGATLDAFALAFALWGAGWLLVSTSAGGDPLRPEFFALLPLSSRRLAGGLTIASFVGVLPAVTVLAFASLVVAAVGLGVIPILVAIVATIATVAAVSLIAMVVVGATGQATQSRLGLEVAAFSQALLFSLIWFWVPLSLLAGGRVGGPLGSIPVVVSVTHLLPTGWGVVAVEAAGRGDWVLAAAALLALGGLVAGLLLSWAVLLERRMTRSGGGRAGARRPEGSRIAGFLDRRLPSTPFGATLGRELRAWSRHPRRTVEIRSAIWTGLILAVLPGFIGSTALWPMAGLVMLMTAAITSSNIYGMDGTALWLTVQTPGSERADVRGRQVAWLLVFGSIALVATIVFTALDGGGGWVWPWVLALLGALAGASVGLVPLISLLVPAPLPERRGGDPLEVGDDARTTGALVTHGVVMTFLPLLLAVPAVAAVAVGEGVAPGLGWVGVPVGIALGAVYAWGFGRLAAAHLASRGPELLERMRARPAPVKTAAVAATRPSIPTATWLWVTIGSIALFPQSLVPMALKLSGSDTRVWFLPLYLPEPLQFPAIVGFAALGLAAFWMAWRLARTVARR